MARFLLFSSRGPGSQKPQDDELIWIGEPDGSAAAMTYAEFRAHSQELEKTRRLPDGKEDRE